MNIGHRGMFVSSCLHPPPACPAQELGATAQAVTPYPMQVITQRHFYVMRAWEHSLCYNTHTTQPQPSVSDILGPFIPKTGSGNECHSSLPLLLLGCLHVLSQGKSLCASATIGSASNRLSAKGSLLWIHGLAKRQKDKILLQKGRKPVMLCVRFKFL